MQTAALRIIFLSLAYVGCAAEEDTGASGTTQGIASLALPTSASAPAATPGLALSVHTTLGIPEAASSTDPSHVLLVKPQYVVSFDSTKKVPRWTSWELSTRWLGSTPRSPAFNRDSQLPTSFGQASNADYSGSGYERGHICPSGDRTDSAGDNEATFVFTNAVPQTSASNTGTWETLEVEERALAKSGHHLFIVAGSIFAASPPTIGAGVAVPASMFKVVVILDSANVAPTDVTASTRVISVEIPNTKTVTGDYKGYRTSFGALEAKTGLRFLSDVPAAVHDALSTEVDAQ